MMMYADYHIYMFIYIYIYVYVYVYMYGDGFAAFVLIDIDETVFYRRG